MPASHKEQQNPNKYKVLTKHNNGRLDTDSFASLEDIKDMLLSYDVAYRRTLLIEVYDNHLITYSKEVGKAVLKKVNNNG